MQQGPPASSPRRSWTVWLTRQPVPVVATFLALIGIWELITVTAHPPTYTLPTIASVCRSAFGDWGTFGPAISSTAVSVIIGFIPAVAIALGAAIVISYSTWARRTIYPLLVGAQLVPKIALAPLFVVWFGFDPKSKVLLIVLITFFPILVDSVVGLGSVRPQTLMLLRSMGATRVQSFTKARFPSALPNIFAGARVSITLAVVGAVVAEFVGSNAGLGSVISNAEGALDTTVIFAAMLWLTLIGITYYTAIVALESVVLGKRRSGGLQEVAGSL